MLTRIIKDMFHKPAPDLPAVAPGNGIPNDAQQWLRTIVFGVFELMHHTEPDNFDSNRYRNQAPNAFFYDKHADYFLFVLQNAEHFFAARRLLTDESSRKLFDRLVLFRILGHLHVRLPFNTPHNRAQADAAQALWTQDTGDVGMFGPLAIFTVPGRDGQLRIKGWKENVMWTFLHRQYFFERDGVKIQPAPGDHAIDAGGCFGDTAIHFADVVGAAGHVYVFDPMPKHCAIMREQLAMNPALAPRITIFPAGLADAANDVGPLPANDVINPGAHVFAGAMPLTTIDDTVRQCGAPRVDFIKMDIEGSELPALRGAQSVLRQWTPKLAISVYHRWDDFFAIPLWIDSLGLGYRFHLDHYTIHLEETVLYAQV